MSKQLKCFIFSDKHKNLRKRTTSLERTNASSPCCPLFEGSTVQLFYNTGVSDLILEHPQLVQGAVYSNPEVSACRKNTGKNRSLRKWSRGHQFIVRDGGHIDTWQSLFRYMHHRKVTVNFNTCHLYCITYSHHNSKFSYYIV